MAGTPNSEIHPATKASAQAVAVVKVRGNTSTHLVVQSMIDKTWVWPSELAVRGPTRYSWRWVKQWWETVMGWTGAVGCVVILAQKHCILLKRTFAQPWILAGLGIRSFAHCSCAHALISLKTNEWLWANCSGRSEEMSNREQFAHVAQRKWAIWANCSFRSWKNEQMSDWLKKFG